MTRLKDGINGPVIGAIGTIVGSSWKGKFYIKARPHGRTKNISIREQLNRKKFVISQAWLRPLKLFLRVGLKGYSPLVEGFVAAKSYLLKNAIEFDGLDVRINPTLVKVSYGDLELPANIAVNLQDGQLQFTWDTRASGNAHPQDQVMLLAYNIEKGFVNYTIHGQFRSVGRQELSLRQATGDVYHIYFALLSVDRIRQSNSVYLGTVTT